MNKTIIENAILSAMNLISNNLEETESDELPDQLEITLAQLENALKELKKE